MSDFTTEEWQRIFQRNQFSLNLLADRIGMLTRENVELLSIIDELQRDLAEARGVLQDLSNSEDVLHPGVASGHAVVQPVAGEQPVPSGNGAVPGGRDVRPRTQGQGLSR
jgi:hypothetical protein